MSKSLPQLQACKTTWLWVSSMLICGMLSMNNFSLQAQNKLSQHQIDSLLLVSQKWEHSKAVEAQQLAKKTIKAARSANYLKGWLEGILTLHNIHINQKKIAEAIRLLDRTFSDAFCDPLAAEELYVYRKLHIQQAYSFFLKGRDYLRAQTHFEACLSIWQSNQAYEASRPNPFSPEDAIYRPLGSIYARVGEYDQALEYLRAFEAYAQRLGRHDLLAEALAEIGIVFKKRKQHQEAVAIFEKGLSIPQVPLLSQAFLYVNLGNTYRELGVYEPAILFAKKGLNIFQLKDQKEEASGSLIILGDVYRDQGDFQTAELYYQQALDIALLAYKTEHRREVAEIYLSKGNASFAQEQYEQALLQYQRALFCILQGIAKDDPYQAPQAKNFYAEPLILEGLHQQALAFHRLFDERQEVELLKHSLDRHYLVGEMEKVLRSNYAYQSAKLHLGRESHKRTEDAIYTAYRLFQLTQESTYADQAFELAERSKAVLLLESIKEAEEIHLADLPDSLKYRENKLKRQVVQYEQAAKLAELNADTSFLEKTQKARESRENYQQFITQLRQTHPSLGKIRRNQTQPISVAEAQAKLLRSKTTMVEYFVGDVHTYIFELTHNKFHLRQLSTEQPISQYIRQLRMGLQEIDSLDDYQQAAQELYHLLIAPLAYPSRRLLIIPDGLLGYIPFDALLTEPVAEGDRNFKSYPYLLHKYTISYAYSATLLHEVANRLRPQKSPKAFLGIAPVFGHRLDRLKYSQEEIRFIHDEWGGDTLVRQQATKAWFMDHADEYQYIHICTHAKTLDSLPERSHIYFWANDSMETSDYLLYLSDLYGLQLQADMVVLSACETGTGQLFEGEGIMSLGRGFILAGCRSLVKTLWSVNHYSAHRIMKHFYEGVFSGAAKDEALRQAKLTYLQKDENIDKLQAHPHFWAAYAPIGDMEALENNFSFWWMILIPLIIVGIWRYARIRSYRQS